MRRMLQFRRQLLVIQFVLPLRHHDGGDAIADKIGQRPAFAHEAVDAQDQGMPATGMVGTTARVMKPAPVMPEAPLEVSMATPRMVSSCSRVRSVLVAWATNRAAIVM